MESNKTLKLLDLGNDQTEGTDEILRALSLGGAPSLQQIFTSWRSTEFAEILVNWREACEPWNELSFLLSFSQELVCATSWFHLLGVCLYEVSDLLCPTLSREKDDDEMETDDVDDVDDDDVDVDDDDDNGDVDVDEYDDADVDLDGVDEYEDDDDDDYEDDDENSGVDVDGD
eukprot:TRINITY_DN1170_c0_g1_i1.p2 TRINITY_DN1170_c0_g1~~TRINITY_DN1170_c0_g1_i1.p2  ORF type:complete len:173 (-),score=73.25 TRINITY_DN1170_c0_g1_i1:34-552(-)